MITRLTIIAGMVLSQVTFFAQNIGINSTGANPNNSAMLDIVSTNRGLLMPRVALTATNAAGPIAAPATSLMVYNTASAGAGATAVTPGFYYWDGAAWQRFDVGNNVGDWKILGNANTTAGTNFLGTTNGQALDFRTNNNIRFRVANANQVHAMANGTSALPFYSWDGDTDIGMYRIGANDIGISTGGVERVSISNGATIFNETSTNTDFRIESNGNANMFYLDGGTNRVSIGTNLSGGTFNVFGNSYFSDDIHLRDGAVNGGDILARIYDDVDDGVLDLYQNNSVDIHLHANDNSYYNPNGNVNRTFMIAHGPVPFYPTLDMFECNSTANSHYAINGYNAAGGVAVYGENLANGFAIFGQGVAASWAGFFDGDVNVTGGYFNFSDKRLKQNVKPFSNSMDELMKLKVYTYNYIEGTHGLDSSRLRYGFIAQELIDVFPDMVAEKPLPNRKSEVAKGAPISQKVLAVSYTELIPVAVSAIQEQQQMILTLEEKVKKLEKLILEMSK